MIIALFVNHTISVNAENKIHWRKIFLYGNWQSSQRSL